MLSLAGCATGRLESELQTRALPGFIPVRKVHPNLTALHYGKMLTLKKKKKIHENIKLFQMSCEFPKQQCWRSQIHCSHSWNINLLAVNKEDPLKYSHTNRRKTGSIQKANN